MHKLLVLYNEPKDPTHFRKYYVEKHLPLSKISGLKASRYNRQTGTGEERSHFATRRYRLVPHGQHQQIW
jgi:uncharacterized protein (TIGR02118 family)